MTATTTNPSFYLFPKLPPEIREMIWWYAMPEKDDPALFSYKGGCWHEQYFLDFPPRPESIYSGREMKHPVCHDMLDPVPVRIPLSSFSYEARKVALAWARQQGSEKHLNKAGECDGFRRRFDPTIDTFYLGAGISTFCLENLTFYPLEKSKVLLCVRKLTSSQPMVNSMMFLHSWWSHLRSTLSGTPSQIQAP
jgi:hypothetical protein